MFYSVAKNPYFVINKKFKTLLLLLAAIALYVAFYNYSQLAEKELSLETRRNGQSEEIHWAVEEKYRNVILNLRHRADFVRDAFEAVLYHNRVSNGDRVIEKPIQSLLGAHNKKTK